MVNPASEASIHEFEDTLIRRIDEMTFIIEGLENHEPYKKVIESWKRTVTALDAHWHLEGNPQKLHEMRVTKMASMELINYIEFLKQDREKLYMELAKIQNPDDIVNKDYDER